jgi:hypothetical protein
MRIIFISNFLPDTNYARDLSVDLVKIMKKDDALF